MDHKDWRKNTGNLWGRGLPDICLLNEKITRLMFVSNGSTALLVFVASVTVLKFLVVLIF